MVPLYTGCLTTTEYGISDLITTTATLLIPIFTLDIQDAVMRFSFDDGFNKKDVFSYGLKIILLGTCAIIIGSLVLCQMHIILIKSEYIIFVILMFFFTVCMNTFSMFCRGIDQVKTLTIGSLVNSIVTLTTNLLFLVVFKMGLLGYLIANTLGILLSTVYIFLSARLYKYVTIKNNARIGKMMRTFSFPLIFSALAWWVNGASDRFILSAMAGVASSGIYAVAYKIPSLLTSFQSVFTQAWSISAVKEFDKNDSDGFIGNLYTIMNFSMIAVCSLIMILNIPLSKLLFAKDFFIAYKYVPPLLISVVFNSMALFIECIFTAVRDTKIISVSTVVGATVNTICNFIFIHFWGAYGAALATMIGYAVMLIMRHVILRKHIHMRLKWKRDFTAYILLFAQMIISNYELKYVLFQCLIFITVVVLYKNELLNILNKIRRSLFKRINKLHSKFSA
jgi:O-antigen/teichoic acid export membrane protein